MILGLLMALCLQDTGRQAADYLLSKQKPDGSFDTRDAMESHAPGYNAIIGLALLSEIGYTPAVEKLVSYIVKQQQANLTWVPEKGGSKFLYSNGYIAVFLLEVWMQEKAGRLKMTPEVKRALQASLEKGVQGILRTQEKDGSWPYQNGATKGHGAYKETATSVGNLHALAMARAAGFDVPLDAFQRGLAYLRANFKDGGFVNGAMEKEPSVHLTPALLCALYWLQDFDVDELIRGAVAFNEEREDSPYWAEWRYDEWEKLPKNLLGQAKALVERRQMFGLFFACLAQRRAGNERKFSALHAKACALLLKYAKTDATWKSTIGEAPATAFALLTFNLSKPDALLFFARKLPAPAWY